MTLFNELNKRFHYIACLINEYSENREKWQDAAYFCSIEQTEENENIYRECTSILGTTERLIKGAVSELVEYLGFVPSETCVTAKDYISAFNTIRKQFKYAYEEMHFQATQNNGKIEASPIASYKATLQDK